MKSFLFALALVLSLSGYSQLKADFTVSKQSGCAPLTVSFNNISTGITANSTFEWNFDNGNTSTLKNPSALFTSEKTFRITLTVREGTQTSSKSMDITVNPKPVIDFEAQTKKGCFPLSVQFNATAQGTPITDYHWDFGDGYTATSPTPNISHTFNYEQDPVINLTVTTADGCQQTLTKQNILKVLPRLTADFSVDKEVLCRITDPATFTNKSTGPGTLSYKWEFGDGGTSTIKDPQHVFATKGTYSIKLTTTSSEGCVAIMEKNSLVNAQNFKSDFTQQSPLICERTYVQFMNASSPTPNETIWENNGNRDYSSYSTYQYFNFAGENELKLINRFGTCYDTIVKKIDVKKNPDLKGFIAELLDSCGPPARLRLRDTTADAVSWKWHPDYPYNYTPVVTNKNEYTFTSNLPVYVYPQLEVTNAAGCKAFITHPGVNLQKAYIYIKDTYSETNYRTSNCGPITTTFSASGDIEITSYKWDFGDGTTSTEKSPTKTFSVEGNYQVRLTYTLRNGCTSTEIYPNSFAIENRRPIDFSASQVNICGNTPVVFNALNPMGNRYYYYNWYYSKDGGDYQPFMYWNTNTHKFEEEGTYSIKVIASNTICADTAEKINYLKVSPPFPKIQSFTPTCEGDRGLMVLTQSSKQALSWTWNFGDGSPSRTLSVAQDTVQYHYTKTGTYKVKLTTTNGACTVSDSLMVPVLMKQSPKLSSTLTQVCQNAILPISIDNLERNPWSSMNNYYWGYSFYPVEYGDGSTFDGGISTYYNFDKPPFVNSLNNLNPNKKDIRIITRSEFFNCTDTTNIIPVKITGPTANFTFANNKVCEQDNQVEFKDASVTRDNNAIVKWDWLFADGTTATKTTNAPFIYQFRNSGYYWGTLTVTDKLGCTSSITKYDIVARKSSVTASISASSTLISPGSTIYYYNNSTSEEPWSTEYKWIKSDGSVISANGPLAETYTTPGFYTVKVVVSNPSQGCSDTASIRIQVKYINAAFDMLTSNISSGKCVPVVVRFTNKSYNISRINWDFGDGTTAQNVLSPSHVYTQPGKYIITAKAYSDNNTEYITKDSVFIEVPQPQIQSNILQACTAQDITLMGNRKDGVTYTWDMGDGTITATTDSFYLHKFKMAGVYNPGLIQTDKNGCSVAVKMKESIIIDSLSIALKNLPAKVCSPKDILFDPSIYSVAADRANQPLKYHWNFGTGNAADTANIKTPSFNFTRPGTYSVSLLVSSPYGCSKATSGTINVFEGLGGKITGPAEICEGSSAQFTASTLIPGTPVYKWVFDDGTTASTTVTPLKKYSAPGAYKLLLLVDNNGCVDSIPTTLQVHSNPVVSLSTRNAVLCEGSFLQVTAGGGTQYQWSPASSIDNISSAVVNINTRSNSTYRVLVSNQYGCSKEDSVRIRVAKPFSLSYQNLYTVCEGNEVKLNVAGATSYQWINNTGGLNSTTSNNPVVKTLVDIQYTVVGKDADNCFTDTARINVKILPLPTVNAGPDVELLTGAPYQLQTSYSPDVVAWKWDPARHLSCQDCPAPILTPLEPTNYVLRVTSLNGCFGYDTVSVKLICSESRIYIPNAFTPDRNGKNDRFIISGYGVKLVKYLRIYNRWGNLVFERTNFKLDDISAAWDGTFNGKPVDSGTYVYVTEMSCNEQSFIKRGTVNVIQ